MNADEQYQSIVSTLKDKSTYKRGVLKQTELQFQTLKTEAEKLATELCTDVDCLEGIDVKFTDKGTFQAELKFGEDVLIFFLHNDVFDFDHSHRIWKTSYVENDRKLAYCGMISIFNFLNTSFEMNRVNDVGYLIGRFYINRENHYFVEGKKQLGFLYNNFANDILTPERIRSIIMSAMQYCQEFDLQTPPFSAVTEVQIGQILEITDRMSVRTGKRLGFRFSSEDETSD
jgi:hypothetical protein